MRACTPAAAAFVPASLLCGRTVDAPQKLPLSGSSLCWISQLVGTGYKWRQQIFLEPSAAMPVGSETSAGAGADNAGGLGAAVVGAVAVAVVDAVVECDNLG